MLSLLFINFNQQKIQTRLLVGILVLVGILFFLTIVFFRLFLYDPLAGYANKNTVFYLHLNLDGKGNYYQEKILNSILDNFQLEDIDRHQFKNELAVICNQQPQKNCFLVFFAENKNATEKYLQDKKITHQTSGFNVFFISQSPSKRQLLKKSWSPMLYWQYHSGLFKDDLTLVLNQIAKPQSYGQKLLAFLKPGIRLSGSIKNQGIVLKPLSFVASKSDWQSEYININQSEFDILINLASPSTQNQPLTKYLDTVFKTSGSEALKVLTDNGFSLIMKKIGSSGDVLRDYQIFISSPANIEIKDIAKLRSIIAEIGAKVSPNEKNVYLNDGTRVIVLSPNQNLPTEQNDQFYQIIISGDQKIFLNSSSSELKIGNNLEFQPKLANNQNNYGLIRLSGLPNHNPIKKYLSDFSFIYFDEDKVIIK